MLAGCGRRSIVKQNIKGQEISTEEESKDKVEEIMDCINRRI
jgi:hypothetical protein